MIKGLKDIISYTFMFRILKEKCTDLQYIFEGKQAVECSLVLVTRFVLNDRYGQEELSLIVCNYLIKVSSCCTTAFPLYFNSFHYRGQLRDNVSDCGDGKVVLISV